ncbi:hypothetical protein ACFLS0_03460 [Candidatus Bipolaricaulota bacterium]
MSRMRVVAAVLSLLILAGCTAPVVPPPASASLQLEIVEENLGWVQVRLAGVPTAGYRILWGDVTTSYGISDVAPWEGLYEHFYQAVEGERSGEQIPTGYQITLVDEDGNIVDQKSIWIAAVVCHLELVSLEGREITVEYWGRFGIDYSISWGDHFADHVVVSSQSARGTASHTYAAPGTYSLGMEEIWAPRRIFFTTVVQ